MSRSAVILVDYNNPDDTEACIDSLLQLPGHPDLVVVENGSSSPDLENKVASYPNARIIHSDSNIGFGRANNIGIRWALSSTSCEFVLLLNNDTAIRKDTISKLEATLDTYEEAGIACPRIVMMDRPDILWFGGGSINWFKGNANVHGVLGAADSKLAMTARPVEFASGCAMLLRRSVLEKVGGFDPRFFMYMEDLEMCLRVQAAGWLVRYVPDALVLHKCQGSQERRVGEFFPIQHPLNPNIAFLVYHLTKNRLLTMIKYARGMNAVRFWGFFPLFWMLKCIQLAVYGRWDAIMQICKGVRDFLIDCRHPFTNELEG